MSNLAERILLLPSIVQNYYYNKQLLMAYLNVDIRFLFTEDIIYSNLNNMYNAAVNPGYLIATPIELYKIKIEIDDIDGTLILGHVWDSPGRFHTDKKDRLVYYIRPIKTTDVINTFDYIIEHPRHLDFYLKDIFSDNPINLDKFNLNKINKIN